jgi:serine/threonine protein kinase
MRREGSGREDKGHGHKERIGNYILGQEIGRGSFATVYKGYRSVSRRVFLVSLRSRRDRKSLVEEYRLTPFLPFSSTSLFSYWPYLITAPPSPHALTIDQRDVHTLPHLPRFSYAPFT